MSTSENFHWNPITNEFEPVGKDSLTSANRTIEIEHALSHDGRGFICTEVVSMASGATFDVLIVNPTSNFPHLRFWDWETTGAPATIELWEGPFTDVVTGTICPLNVTNRVSSNVTSVTLYGVSSVTLNNSLSTRLENHVLTGAKQEGGTQEGTAIEWIFNHDTDYLIRITNDSGGAIRAGLFVFLLQPEGT